MIPTIFELFKCARATSSGQNSQWMTLKGLYCTGGALKQRIPGIIWANPLKMHGGSCGGYLVFRVAHETLGRLGIWEWDAVKKRSILVIQGGLNVSHCSKTRSSNIETYGRIDNGSTTVRPHVTWNTHTHTQPTLGMPSKSFMALFPPLFGILQNFLSLDWVCRWNANWINK